MTCSIAVSVARADEQLLKQNRSERELRKYRSAWKSLMEYAKWYRITDLSWELACCYWRECCGFSLFDDFTKTQEFSLLFESKVRPLLVLLLMQKGGTFLRNQRVDLGGDISCFSGVLDSFTTLCQERNLKPSTIKSRLWAVNPFLHYVRQQGISDVSDIQKWQVIEYAKGLAARSLNTAHAKFGNLRSFLQFLFDKQLTNKNLSGYLPKISPPKRRLARVWTSDEIKRILDAIERGTSVGKRDYAVFMLVSHLGLRSGDICNLQFDNINWAECKISILQDKTGNALELPFNEEVGSAIIDYLKHGRPKGDASQFVFVRHSQPFGKVKNFWYPMQKYLREAKIPIVNERPHGMHTFRFALATRMLDEEIPIETISAVLGHESVASTLRYLRADINKLRECALNPDEVFCDA